MRRGAIAAGALLTLTAATAGTAEANQTTCVYDAATRTATATVTVDGPAAASSLGVNTVTGAIVVFGSPAATPCGAATRTNTDTVVINSGPPSGGSIFYFGGTAFAPGFTNEPGSSDEIEFILDFTGTANGANRWFLAFQGGPSGLNLAMGGNQVNLNPSESDGIDADATISGFAKVLVLGSSGEDTIRAGGGFGTPGPFLTPLSVATGAGPDTLVGGRLADNLSGGLDDDVVIGGRGKDSLKGEGGIDRLFGGKGNDKLLGGSGAKDILDGGAGKRDQCTTKVDKNKRCELYAKEKT